MPTILHESSLEFARKKYPVAFKILYFIAIAGIIGGAFSILFGSYSQY